MVLAAALAIGGLASVADAAVEVLYEQTFNADPGSQPFGANSTIELQSSWQVENVPDGFSGTYATDFDAPEGLFDARTGASINGNTGIYMSTGSNHTDALGMFWTEAGIGGFPDDGINPDDCPHMLLTIYSNRAGGNDQVPSGTDDQAYFTVLLGDGDPRTADQWYVATQAMDPPGEDGGHFMNWRTMDFSLDAGVWTELSVGPLTRGPVAGDLNGQGLIITGAGILAEITNGSMGPFGDFTGLNYADYRILCVPEPSMMALVALAGPMLFVLRSRKR
jgi:hypothetical protein